jgi:hypothetical protein
MKKIWTFRQYTRKMEHIKRSHQRKASMQFMFQYIDEMNKTCQVCKNIKPLKGSIKLHGSQKHLGKTAKEFAPTF